VKGSARGEAGGRQLRYHGIRTKYVEGTLPGLMTGILPKLHAAGSAELDVNGRKHGRIGRPMEGI